MGKRFCQMSLIKPSVRHVSFPFMLFWAMMIHSANARQNLDVGQTVCDVKMLLLINSGSNGESALHQDENDNHPA